MNLFPIQDFIQSQTTLINGVDLFVYSMPAPVTAGVLLTHESAGNRVDHEMPGIFEGRFQVIVRDTDYDLGFQRAWEIFYLLTLLEQDLTDYIVTYCRPRHTPMPFSRSDGDLIEFSINFDLRYRNA